MLKGLKDLDVDIEKKSQRKQKNAKKRVTFTEEPQEDSSAINEWKDGEIDIGVLNSFVEKSESGPDPALESTRRKLLGLKKKHNDQIPESLDAAEAAIDPGKKKKKKKDDAAEEKKPVRSNNRTKKKTIIESKESVEDVALEDLVSRTVPTITEPPKSVPETLRVESIPIVDTDAGEKKRQKKPTSRTMDKKSLETLEREASRAVVDDMTSMLMAANYSKQDEDNAQLSAVTARQNALRTLSQSIGSSLLDEENRIDTIKMLEEDSKKVAQMIRVAEKEHKKDQQSTMDVLNKTSASGVWDDVDVNEPMDESEEGWYDSDPELEESYTTVNLGSITGGANFFHSLRGAVFEKSQERARNDSKKQHQSAYIEDIDFVTPQYVAPFLCEPDPALPTKQRYCGKAGMSDDNDMNALMDYKRNHCVAFRNSENKITPREWILPRDINNPLPATRRPCLICNRYDVCIGLWITKSNKENPLPSVFPDHSYVTNVVGGYRKSAMLPQSSQQDGLRTAFVFQDSDTYIETEQAMLSTVTEQPLRGFIEKPDMFF